MALLATQDIDHSSDYYEYDMDHAKLPVKTVDHERGMGGDNYQFETSIREGSYHPLALVPDETSKRKSLRKPKEEKALADEVAATIVVVDDVAVSCEVNVESRFVRVRLPRTLFPENIHYGMPVSISYRKNEIDLWTPSVKVRKIQKANTQIARQKRVRALIDQM